MMVWMIFLLCVLLTFIHLFQEFRLLYRANGIVKGIGVLSSTTPKSNEEIEVVVGQVRALSPFFHNAANQLKRNVRLWEGEARLISGVQELFNSSIVEEGSWLSAETRRMVPLLVGLLGAAACVLANRQYLEFVDVMIGLTSSFTVIGLLIHLLVKERLDRNVQRLQQWLESIIEPLPQAQELTRDMIFHLQTQIKNVEKSHQKSLAYMAESQGVLADLGKNLQSSFSKSVQTELAPTLKEVTQMANRIQVNNQRYIEDASQKQVQAVQGLIGQVMTGIDQAIGDNLRDTSESFAASVQRQQISMDRWRRSVESVSDVISSLEGTTKALTMGADKMAQAAQPVENAAEVFAISAQQLQSALPAITEIAQVYHKAQATLEQAHVALERGTAGYLETSSNVREMVQNLREAHVEAIKRISNGVDEAVLSSMREAGVQLKSINEAQAKSLSSWVDASQSVEISAQQMKLTAEQMAHFSHDIKAASEPTVQASKAFLSAAESLQETVPKLEQAASVHDAGKEALETAAEALSRESRRYTASANLVHEMVQNLQEAQKTTISRVSAGIDQAITENLQQAGQVLGETIVVAAEQIKTSGNVLSTQLMEASDNTALTLQHSIGELSTQLEMSSTMITQVLTSSIEGMSMTLQNSADIAGASMVDSLSKSAEELQGSLQGARQQMADTLTNTIRVLENSLLNAGSSLVENWDVTGENIKDAMEHASKKLDQSVQEVGKKLNQRVDDAGRMLETSVTESANLLRLGAKDAQEHLSNVGTDWSSSIQDASQALRNNAELAGGFLSDNAKLAGESMRNNVETAGHSMLKNAEIAGDAIRENAETAGGVLSVAFQNADQQIQESLQRVGRQMESSLQENHARLSATLSNSSRDLKELSEAQSTHLFAWTKIVETLRPALSDLRNSAVDLDGLVGRLQETIAPTTVAAQNFRVASENITAVFPNIGETAQSYQEFNKSLVSATTSLSTTARNYADAGSDMSDLLSGVRQSLLLQSQSNESVSATLDQAAETIRSLEPISVSMRDAAGDIRLISEQTAGTVDVIHRATSAQNTSVQQMSKMSADLLAILSSQSQQLGGVTQEMENLQQVLTSGVHAFSKVLPKSVDHTLVQFDAALGEGVNRLGSAIERLREAMDDLIEQLDNVKKR